MRRWLEHHHGSLGGLRVRVPVSLHHEGDAVANRDSFFSLRLPLNEPEERWAELGMRVLEPGETMQLDLRLELAGDPT